MGNDSRRSRRTNSAIRSLLRHGRWTAFVAMLLLTGLCGTVQASTIFVTSLEQKISETGGCSLQEAIYSANFDNNIAIDSLNLDGTDHFITTECVAGNGDDTIVLPTRAVLQMGTITDESYNYMGPTATPIIFTNITIEAHGARLEHLANGVNFRAFAVGTASISTPGGTVSGTGNLTIRNVHIKGFTVKGGDGGDGYFGGGGGMGAGGAIYVDGGVLTVDASTFEGNGAAGGAGGAYTNPVVGGEPGGGGGGLSGNGGDAHAGVFTGSGGGGARGNGAESISGTDQNGGHGGGTFSDGIGLGGFVDGFRCGGNGGDKTGYDNDGQGGTCAGGGGGGGATADSSLPFNDPGTGGNGNYGGGGGGGGSAFAGGGSNGGKGGFGGGGGGCGGIDDIYPYNDGGNGGFGGGGGACSQNIGKGGAFGGESSLNGGGGGAGLGGAIFNSGGTVTIRNSTFTGNFVTRGAGSDGAENGADAGAAIFSLWGSLSMFNSTVDGNESTGPLGGVFFDNRGLGDCGFFEACLGPSPSFFTLRNTIIAHNGVGFNAPRECSIFDPASSDFYKPVLTVAGSGNLITQNETGNITGYLACPGVVATGDPQLGPLQNNQGPTPTMAIPITWPAPNTNPAFNAADAATSLATDQRGQERPQEGGYDIGAFELCVDNSTGLPCLILSGILDTRQLTIQTSSAAGGTVSPAPGTYSEPLNSVVVVAATPNPNYCFVNWTGPVTIPTSPSTTVVINDEQTVTANFAAFNNTVAKPLLNPSTNHGLVNVGLAASNNCGDPATLQVQVFGDEDDQTPTDKKGTVFSPDATNIAVSTLRLRAERTDSGDGRVYLIVVRNNTGFGCNTVVVPHDSSALSLASVNSQAAAALAYCQANNGTAPAAYFVIGDGPVIGSKQ